VILVGGLLRPSFDLSRMGHPGIGRPVNRLSRVSGRYCDSPLGLRPCEGTVYTVVDATTGQRLADYQADKDTAGEIACYAPNPDRFFTFAFSDHHLQIVEAAAK